MVLRLVSACFAFAALHALHVCAAIPQAVFAQDRGSGVHDDQYAYPEMDPRAHEDLRPFHDVVSTWQDREGKSCCDERDCRIVEDYVVGINAATGEEEYSVRVFGHWWAVPREAVRPYTSVTFGVIACYYWVWELDGLPHPKFRCVVGPHNS